ncbi:MAG: LexA family transcriptional regulator [Planctomycetes bacterium]|nr:LexA family transcriptional regulator [Planctomycetota bacterium]
MAAEENQPQLSERLKALREMVYGGRGRAKFARALNVSPSTYNYYEKGRQPPADLLARAAEVTGADLTWLLTGQGEPFPGRAAQGTDKTLSHPAQEILARFPAAIAAGPPGEPGRPAAAAEAAATPAAPQAAVAAAGPAAPAAAEAALRTILERMEQAFPGGRPDWQPSQASPEPGAVPVVGRTAAGILASWERFFAGKEEADVLERLIGQTESQAARQRSAGIEAADAAAAAGPPPGAAARLVQLSAPTPDGIIEYLELPGLESLGPGAFALRVDGDSMAPRIRDGDIVVCRRSVGPEPGRTAVVKVRGRVGVTVKLWRPEGRAVHLIPINEAYQPSRLPRADVVWACRVLWVVRL